LFCPVSNPDHLQNYWVWLCLRLCLALKPCALWFTRLAMFVWELLIGLAFICLTVLVHAIALDRLMIWLKLWGPNFYRTFRGFWKMAMLVVTVLGIFASHIIQMWVWAALYYYGDALPNWETALYFSTSTFTTVGYGDVLLPREWRLIGSVQSANGFILFGWSTAFIFEIMSKLYKHGAIPTTERWNQ